METTIIAQEGLYLPMLLAGFSVMSGVSLKNTGEKLWEEENLKLLGMFFFVGGWILAALAFHFRYQDAYSTFQPTTHPLIILPVVGIVLAAAFMNMLMAEGEEVPVVLPILFVLSWLGFVGLIALASGTVQPFLAAFLVFLSMMWLIPKERKAGVADGIGMVLFFIAFIILANSMARN